MAFSNVPATLNLAILCEPAREYPAVVWPESCLTLFGEKELSGSRLVAIVPGIPCVRYTAAGLYGRLKIIPLLALISGRMP